MQFTVSIAPPIMNQPLANSRRGALPTLGIVAAFLAYCATLLAIEWAQGQDAVRPYFADVVQGPPFLFAVNTTLASGLQGIASVLFFVAWQVGRMRGAEPVFLRMAAGQVLFFAWTAADDRFLLHERLPNALEGVYWIALGSAYVAFLLLHRSCFRGRQSAVALLLLGGALFAGMLGADLLVADAARLRLSVEDLLKAAASLALAGFAWHYLKAELAALGTHRPVRTSAP